MKRWIRFLGMEMLLLFLTAQITFAAAENSGTSFGECEIVYLLDTSGSMNTQDKDRLAIDALRQAAYSLPSGYKAGLVAYNTGIQTIIPFDTGPEQMEAQLASIRYSGYTNAGEGLSQAMGLFSDRADVERYILMLTDGEIDMPDKKARDISRALYTEKAGQAKEKGIKICIIAVGSELKDPQMHIFDGAELTDGTIYWEGESGSLSQIMDRITSERLGFPRETIGVTDAGGGKLHVKLPENAGRVKLLITSDSGFGDVMANYTSESGRTITGKRFAVVDLYRPDSEALDVGFLTSDLSGVKASLLTEFSAVPSVTAVYRSEEQPRTEKEIKKNIPPKYNHFVDVTIEMTDNAANHNNLWLGDGFEGQEISYLLNGISYSGKLEQGKLHQTIPAEDIDEVEVSVDTSGLKDVYYVEQPVTVDIEKYADPVFVPLPDYRPLWAVLGVLAAAVAALVLWWVRKKNTTVIYVAQPPASREPTKKMETRTCTYSGKLNMYVVRNENGRDIPPQTYRLFGRRGGRMTLNQVLATCGIKFGKIGAEDIILYPGPEQSLIVMDQSEGCTMLRGTEILKKGMGYPVFYNEKLTVTFEDEATEMEIHYKNLKPSEREII